MRRFILFTIFVLALIVGFGYVRYQRGMIDFGSNAVYSFYVTNNIKGVSNYSNVVANGNTFIVSVNSDELHSCYSNFYPYIFAFSAHFSTEENFDFNAFKTRYNVTMVATEELADDATLYYGKGNFGLPVHVNGANVNVQVAFTNDGVYIGFPLIVGSY